MPEFVGNREHFHYWLNSGSIMQIGGGSRSFFTVFNEGGAPLRLGNQSGTALVLNGFLLVSGGYVEDAHADDDWWAFNMGAGSGSLSGWITRNSV